METKFKVGQVWKDRNGRIRIITDILEKSMTFPVRCETDEDVACFTLEGRYFGEGVSPFDLVEQVIASVTPIQGEALDETRTAFIEKMTHDVFWKYIEIGTAEDAEKYVRAAVKLRDELVRGE